MQARSPCNACRMSVFIKLLAESGLAASGQEPFYWLVGDRKNDRKWASDQPLALPAASAAISSFACRTIVTRREGMTYRRWSPAPAATTRSAGRLSACRPMAVERVRGAPAALARGGHQVRPTPDDSREGKRR